MADYLLIAHKHRQAKSDAAPETARFISLKHRSQGFACAGELSRSISAAIIRRFEDSPCGDTRLTIGDEPVKEMLTAPCLTTDGGQWGTVRRLDSVRKPPTPLLTRSSGCRPLPYITPTPNRSPLLSLRRQA